MAASTWSLNTHIAIYDKSTGSITPQAMFGMGGFASKAKTVSKDKKQPATRGGLFIYDELLNLTIMGKRG